VKSTDFDFVTGLLHRRAGIQLTTDKTYLLESRLAPLARKEGLASIEDLLQVVRSRRDERLINQIVDVMTTNETFFFRDKTPFDTLKEAILPDLVAQRKPRLRIWCAACSTGQEPYSIAMMLDENPNLVRGAKVEIVGTDISNRVLDKAKAGLYSQFEVQRGLPVQSLMKHFKQKDDVWQISDKMRASVKFKEHNLMDEPTAFGKFDVVFCRNVLIYFDPQTKAKVLKRISSVMNPGGSLLLGAAETVVGVTKDFEATKERRGLFKLATGAKTGSIRAA
jgi:chemotaxis protein methyltransferase CheR